MEQNVNKFQNREKKIREGIIDRKNKQVGYDSAGPEAAEETPHIFMHPQSGWVTIDGHWRVNHQVSTF